VLDTVGNRPLSDIRRVLTPKGTAVLIGGDALGSLFAAFFLNLVVGQQLVSFIAKINRDDLAYLGDLAAAGKLTPAIDRSYPLAEAAEAIRYLETRHVRGKVVISVTST
jgi:NADPH:quinone reductase-like Zn-dependent oxidoreductase